MSASPPPTTLDPRTIAGAPGAETQAQVNLQTNIFGGDEDDDLTSDEEGGGGGGGEGGDGGARQKAARSPSPASESSGESDEDGDGDAYEPGARASQGKIKKKRRASVDDAASASGSGSGGETAPAPRVKKDKKRKKGRTARADRHRGGDEGEGEGEEADTPIDAAKAKRDALNLRIDNIGKKNKAVRRKKRNEEDIVDTMHEDLCRDLKKRMEDAVAADIQARAKGNPAMKKLLMLDEVMSVLRNATAWQAVIDSQLLESVRLFLEPMDPSGDLPAVGIQRALFEVLPKMDLDTPTLKECGLGRVVLFYTKSKRVAPEISRQADALVQAWSRPIIKRPTDFRVRHVDTADGGDGDGAGVGGGTGAEGAGAQRREDDEDNEDDDGEDGDGEGRKRRRQGGMSAQTLLMGQQRIIKKRFNVQDALDANKGRKGARMPIVKSTQYTVAPESRTAHHNEDLQHVARIQSDNRKFNKFARALKMGAGAKRQ